MAVVTFLSAKGSPGVTTTALLAAALWPRPSLLLEADPAGGDLAARVGAPDGGVLDTARGLLPLLSAARHGLDAAAVLDQAQSVAGGTQVVLGVGGPGQAVAAGRGWAALAAAVGQLGRSSEDRPGGPGPLDVLVDAGRVGAAPLHLDLLRAADVVAVLVRAETAAVLHARDRLQLLQTALRRPDGSLPRLGVVVVGDTTRRAGDLTSSVEVLLAAGPSVEDLGRLPLDPVGASVFAGGRVARPERTALVRAGRTLVAGLVSTLPAAQAPVVPVPRSAA